MRIPPLSCHLLVLIGASCLAVAFPSLARASENIIANPGLEQGVGEWKLFVPGESKDKGCSFSISTEAPRTGGSCVEMKSDDYARYSIGHMGFVGGKSPKQGEKYRLSFWIRAAEDTDSREPLSFLVRMLLFDENGEPLPDAPALFFGLNGKSSLQFQAKGLELSDLAAPLPHQWTQIVCEFEVPGDLPVGKVLSPEFTAYYTRGAIYLDDVSLEPVDESASAPPSVNKALLELPAIFSDHAVLQRSGNTSVWGRAAPGGRVQIAFGSNVGAKAVADGEGLWHATLDVQDMAQGPWEMKVSSENAEVTIHDLLIGDVWICSGQSNMEFKLVEASGGADEIAHAGEKSIRFFVPQRQAVAAPSEELAGRWIQASPVSARLFSAVAWYFATTVQASAGVPLGLVDTSWGGTPAEAWISAEGLNQNPDLKSSKDSVLAARSQEERALKEYPNAVADWLNKYQRLPRPTENPEKYAGPSVDLADWKSVRLPGDLSDSGLPDSGTFWLRTTVDIPANKAGAYLPLMLGTLHDFEEVYWNGKKIGETDAAHSTSMNPELKPTTNRRYDVPGPEVKAGSNTLAIRLFSPAGNAGIEARQITAGWTIHLTNPWFARQESGLPPLPEDALKSYPPRPPWPSLPHYTATYLFNGLVYPLRHLSISGVIWYQGEGNVGRAWQYRTTFPLLIADWRRTFQRPDLPFYFCQLASFGPKKSEPAESEWAELREAQQTALDLPHTGMATLIDLGEEEDIHPRNKLDVGRRLGAIALAATYRKDGTVTGPVLQSTSIEGSKIRVYFATAGRGLKAVALPESYRPKSTFPATKRLAINSPGSELQGFTICGDDGKWVWANARIEENSVLVWSDQVPAPKYVRYAWADNPTCNLQDSVGLPARPFRSDQFAASTINRKY